MITWIVAEEPEARPQRGEPTRFSRRTPPQSRLPDRVDARKLYDRTRMLDAPGYPTAFAETAG